MRSALDLLRELRAGNAPGATAPQPSELSPCPNPTLVTGRTTPGTAALPADEASEDWLGLRVASRVLGEDVWLAPDEPSAEMLEAELAAEGEPLLIFTIAEVLAMEGMLAADMQKLARIKRWLPGSRIDSVTPRSRESE